MTMRPTDSLIPNKGVCPPRELMRLAEPVRQLGLIAGPSGSGKSTVMRYLRARYSPSCVVGAKFTTRPRRITDEDWEFQFVEELPARLRPFSYTSIRWQYAIDVDAVERALNSGHSYFVICTDATVSLALSRRFPTCVVYVHRALTTADIRSLLAERHCTDADETRMRTAELTNAINEYALHLSLYDCVLLNTGRLLDLHAQVDSLMAIMGHPASPTDARTL